MTWKKTFVILFSEIQANLEQERRERSHMENRLLNTEKKNNELLVDLSQVQQQIVALKSEISAEINKVSE